WSSACSARPTPVRRPSRRSGTEGEGGLMSAPERAPLGAALAMLLTVGSLTGAHSPVLMAGAIGVLSVLLAISWPELLELPSAIGTRLVMGAAGIAGAGLALLTGQDVTGASAVVMVCGAGVFAAFVHQMLRRDRHRLTASLTGTVSGVFIATISACWVLAQAQAVADGATGVVTAISAGLAGALLLNTLPVGALARLLLAVVGGTGVTVLVAASLTGLNPLLMVGIGVVVTVSASSAQLLLGSSLVSAEPVPSLAPAAGSVATVVVVADVLITMLL